MCWFKRKIVGVPDHLFFRRIAGPSGRRDFQNWTQMKYCDTFAPFLPYKMIPCWIDMHEVQIPSPGETWHKSDQIKLHRTPLIYTSQCRSAEEGCTTLYTLIHATVQIQWCEKVYKQCTLLCLRSIKEVQQSGHSFCTFGRPGFRKDVQCTLSRALTCQGRIHWGGQEGHAPQVVRRCPNW